MIDLVGHRRMASHRHAQTARLLAAILAPALLATPGIGAVGAAGLPSQPAPFTRYQMEASATPASRDLTVCLLRGWLHSHEEDSQETVVYRPDDYPFPPSRGRVGFEFLAGGYLIYQAIAPADGPELMHGRWEQTSPGIIEIEIDEPEQPVKRETLEIVSCSEELLEIAR